MDKRVSNHYAMNSYRNNNQGKCDSGDDQTLAGVVSLGINKATAKLIFNYALQQNGEKLIDVLSVTNNTDVDLNSAVIRIGFDPDYAYSIEEAVDLPAGETIEFSPIISFKTSYLLGLTEKQTGMLSIEVSHKGMLLAQRHWSVELLACDEWAGSSFNGEMLAAFVTPNHPAVSNILTLASKVLTDWGVAPSLEGYQLGSSERVIELMAAIYEALRQSNIVYNDPPASFEAAQRVRLPHKVLEEHKGTCLDLSLLYAACLEAAGLHPLLILIEGHAFAACWLGEGQDDVFTGGYTDSYKLMLEKTAKASQRIYAVNCVNFCVDGTGFEAAHKVGSGYFNDPDKFCYALDIAGLRKRQEKPVRPIALATSVEETAAPDINESHLLKADRPKITLAPVKQVQPEDGKAYAKQRYWEKKLLDVSLANPLISLYKRRFVTERDAEGNVFKGASFRSNNLAIAWRDIGRLEDRLADGLSFRVRYDLDYFYKHPDKEMLVAYTQKLVELGVSEEELEKNPEIKRKARNHAVETLIENSFVREQLFLKDGGAEPAKRLKAMVKTAKRSVEENGANTLYLVLGELRWFAEPIKRPEKPFCSEEEKWNYEQNCIYNSALYAPLILVPVDLIRNSNDDSYYLRSRQEETQINVTLLEFLKQNFGIEIDGLDPLPLDAHGVDIELILNKIKLAIKEYDLWDVTRDTSIGHFSFAKFVMWSDIHNHAVTLAENKVIDSLLHGGRRWTPKQESITEANIEQVAAEYNMLVPSSADSSQLVAVAKALSGESFVLQGPPGTGKSQTITNLIANALYNDKKVLFVAEKKAALDVVKKRLDEMGLAHFCLSLHSDDANKLSVLARLEQTLEITATAQTSEEYKLAVAEIKRLRNNLNAVISAMHDQRDFGCSLYQAITILKKNSAHKGKISLSAAVVDELDQKLVLRLQALVREYKGAMLEMGGRYDSSLDGYNGTAYSMLLREQFSRQVEGLRQGLPAAASDLQAFYTITGITAEQMTFSDLASKLTVCKELGLPDNILPALAVHEAPEQTVAEIRRFLRQLEAYKKDLSACSEYFDLQVLDIDIKGAKTAWEFASKMGDFDGRCNKLLADLQYFAKPGVVIKREVMQYNYNYLGGLVDKGNALLLMGKNIKNYLGSMYNGINTDTVAVEDAVAATLAFLQRFNRQQKVLQLPLVAYMRVVGDSSARRQVGQLTEFIEALAAFAKEYAIDATVWSQPYFAMERVQEMLDSFAANTSRLRSKTAYNAVAAKLKDAGLAAVVTAFEQHRLTVNDIEGAFAYALYYSLVMHTLMTDTRLADFYGMKYNEMIKRYRKVIASYQKACVEEIELKLRHKVANVVNDNRYAEQIGILKKAIKGKGRNKPIRKLFSEIQTLLPELAPCMLMNPISVAQYLAIDFPKFDLVVFDEASQIPTSEAVGAIARGIDAVVVGDPKQMPPTTFFATEVTEVDEDVEDMESLLIDCQTISMPVTELKWHYRSQHESLIAFSNVKYYGSNLYTFPTPDDLVSEVKIVHPEGYYDRKTGCNKAEAQAIVAEILRRYRDPLLRKSSIGVITFNIKQQSYIEDLLEKTLHMPENVDLAGYNISQNVFIKNLENVQGDEADVILFSIGYAPDKDGRLTMNFGPLNRDGGWRRLNVAVSRSRREMVVYSVLRPEQIRSDVSAQGVRNLKEFLDYAENRKTLCSAKQKVEAADTEYIVAEIAHAIKDMGYEVSCDIGNSEFKMDIGVINPYNPEQYLLGILLDSENCKEAATARDRFVLQPDILQRLGWKLLRLWVLDWLDDPLQVKNKLQTLLAAERVQAQQAYENQQKALAEQKTEQQSATVADMDPEEEETEEVMVQAEGAELQPSVIKPQEGQVKPTIVEQEKKAQDEAVAAEPPKAQTEAEVAAEKPKARVDSVLEVEQKKAQAETPVAVAEQENNTPAVQPVKRKLSRRGPKEYKQANIKIQGEQNDFYQPANRELIKGVIEKLLAKEAPIELGALRERVMTLWGFNKAGQKFTNSFADLLCSMQLCITHDRDKDFVWATGQQPEEYNIYRDMAERSLQQVCTQELLNGMYVAARENGSLMQEDLLRETAKRFGCNKFTKAVEETFSFVLQQGLREEIFRVLNNGKVAIFRR